MAMYELSFGFRRPYQVLGGFSTVEHTIERDGVDGRPQWMQGCVPPLWTIRLSLQNSWPPFSKATSSRVRESFTQLVPLEPLLME